jgi:hypothetical protein
MMATSVSLHVMSHVREADLRGVQVWGGELYTKDRSGGATSEKTIVAGTKKQAGRKEQREVVGSKERNRMSRVIQNPRIASGLNRLRSKRGEGD